MGPDFSKKTKDTLAKFAAYQCSNPICGILTVGPNKAQSSPTSLGQAAHIYGARPSSARYKQEMTDAARAEITNGIWLCANCHKKIDDDEITYPADLLFRWRETHEDNISAELGDPDAGLRVAVEKERLAKFALYPAIIRRIVADKPPCWEWRLTAELMRHLNAQEFRRLDDLRAGLYSERYPRIHEEETLDWLVEKCREMERLVEPLGNLIPRLGQAWGEGDAPGDEHEILHIALLIRDGLSRVVDHEEELEFASFPYEAAQLVSLLKNAAGAQLAHFKELPEKLDEIVELALEREAQGYHEPLIIHHDIIFDLPAGWGREVDKEISRFGGKLSAKHRSGSTDSSQGCAWVVVIGIVVFLVIALMS